METPEAIKNTAVEAKDLKLNPAAKAMQEKAATAKAADPVKDAAVVKAADPAKEVKTKKTKKAVKAEDGKKVKVKILAVNMAGKYLLPFNPGQIAEVSANQAEEILEAGDGILPTAEDLKK